MSDSELFLTLSKHFLLEAIFVCKIRLFMSVSKAKDVIKVWSISHQAFILVYNNPEIRQLGETEY